MQKKIMFNGYAPPNLAEDGYKPSFAVTSTANSGRGQRGKMYNTVMFTVEAFDLKWTHLTTNDLSNILKQVMGKSSFDFTYFSPYHNKWRTDKFYMANATLDIKRLNPNNEKVSELSFQVTGINPITRG